MFLSASDALTVVCMWSCAEFACFLCAAVWSWTLNCRKISYSLWWRDCVPRRSPCSLLCPILRRPSAPRPNASPKRRPRNTRAGNSGFCDRRITYTAFLCFWSYFQEGSTTECNAPCASAHLLSYFDQDETGKSYRFDFFLFSPLRYFTDASTELGLEISQPALKKYDVCIFNREKKKKKEFASGKKE